MGAADWREVEGGALGLFQEVTELWGKIKRVKWVCECVSVCVCLVLCTCTCSLQVELWQNTASSLIGSLLSVKEIVISNSKSNPFLWQKEESSASSSALCKNSYTAHTHTQTHTRAYTHRGQYTEVQQYCSNISFFLSPPVWRTEQRRPDADFLRQFSCPSSTSVQCLDLRTKLKSIIFFRNRTKNSDGAKYDFLFNQSFIWCVSGFSDVKTCSNKGFLT